MHKTFCNKKLRVMTIVGTRPEIIRLSRVISKLDESCEHTLVHTGQNYDYELNEIFFQELGIKKPDYFLSAAGSTGSETIGKVIIEIDKLLEIMSIDAILILGDTNSCMSVIPAKRRKIPTFHMEAGNRCFDMRVPEEINRKIVDHTADINLPYSSIARQYLLNEGLPPDRIIKTGSPMFEVLENYKNDIFNSKILETLNLSKNGFFLVSSHREENIDPPGQFEKFVKMLNDLSIHYDIPVVVSTHPRTRKKIEATDCQFNKKINFLKPLGFFDYNKLQIAARIVLSDSGTITEEASILKFNAINLRETHERPEGMEEGVVFLTGFDVERIVQVINLFDDKNRSPNSVEDYKANNVSEKIVTIIHSYVNYVNRVIWSKEI
jgi:UDP-N-acetyl-L-fucosamine synthase